MSGKLSGKQVRNASRTLRDVQWYTWTCASGWPTQALPEGTSFCERSRDSTTIAFADDKGRVMLAPWPMLSSGDKRASATFERGEGGGGGRDGAFDVRNRHLDRRIKVFEGAHRGPISELRFVGKGKKGMLFLVSVGAADNAIFVWRVRRR